MPVTRLVAKLEAYGRLQQSGGPSFPVIFWLPNRLREKHLHEALAMGPVHADVAVVTGVHGPGRGDPTVAVWAIADSSTSSDVATPASRVTLGALSRWSTSLTLPAESTESPWQ